MNEIDRLFESLFRNTIGFDNLRPYLRRDAVSFPRYDVIQIDSNNYVVQLALAGYKPDDVEVIIEDNVLYIQTAKYSADRMRRTGGFPEHPNDKSVSAEWDSSGTVVVSQESGRETKKVLHRGIAKRDFKLSFALPEHFEVAKAEFDNGLLCVELFKKVPEALKPKKIPVTLAG